MNIVDNREGNVHFCAGENEAEYSKTKHVLISFGNVKTRALELDSGRPKHQDNKNCGWVINIVVHRINETSPPDVSALLHQNGRITNTIIRDELTAMKGKQTMTHSHTAKIYNLDHIQD